jgi:Domain of unknown function (DUF4333)
MPMCSSAIRIVGIAVLIGVAVACTKTLDTDGLEEQLQTQVAAELGTTITAVDCPPDVEVESGGTFNCMAEDESGATFTLKITQRDDQGNVRWSLASAGDAGG